MTDGLNAGAAGLDTGAAGLDAGPGGRRHTYLCPMRWSDMDAQGHVNNSAFFVYLEQARIDLFFDLAGTEGIDSLARGVVVARHEIDYRRPVLYSARPLRIELWCSHIGGASFTVDYALYDDSGNGAGPAPGPVAVQARTRCVPYHLAAGRARRLEPAEREFLARYLGQA
ncbi:MAG TPA: acyl-CoA thioesterase [Mycobacteriales bacterium]|nr:acyl-CoA thioesterase [Mycobacteriales bacterium]